jgi:hypothetical protein
MYEEENIEKYLHYIQSIIRKKSDNSKSTIYQEK